MWRVQGRRVKETVRGTQREAERRLTAVLAARDGGAPREPSRERFAVHADEWLASKRGRVALGTVEAYQKHLDLRLKPFFGEKKLRQIDRRLVRRYIASLDGEVGPKTINDSLVPLRQVLARAVRDGIIAANPASSVDRDDPLELRHEPPQIQPLTGPQARSYLEAAPGWFRPVGEVLLGTGMRIGELIGLEWRDVDWDASSLRIERAVYRGRLGKPKSGHGRSVHVDGHVLGVLRDHRRAQFAAGHRGELVFTTPFGRRLAPNGLREGHVATLDSAELPRIRLHDLRHTAATLWLAAGESVYFVQQQLGHADLKTTIGTYGHPDRDAHRAAAERAAAWWRASG